MSGESPGFREGLGIVNDVLDGQMTQVRTGDAFDHFHIARVRDTGFINPGDVVLSDRLDDESVAFPMADGIAEPSVLDLRIMRTAIQEDFSPDMRSAFVYDDEHVFCLNEAPWVRRGAHARNARRQAASFRIVFAESCFVLFIYGPWPREQRDINTGANHVDVLTDRIRRPVAGEIRMAVGSTGRGSFGRPVRVLAGSRSSIL